MHDDVQILWDFLSVHTVAQRSDLIFCFGSSHLGPARRAAELFARGVAPAVLVSGGVGGRVLPEPTEADSYAEVLRCRGVPDRAIVVEREARNTGENVQLGMQQVLGQRIRVRSTVLVAFPISLRRCAATFALRYPGIRLSTAPAFEGLGPYRRDPQRAGAAVLAEMNRLRTYPGVGYMAPVEIPGTVNRAAARLVDRLGFRSRPTRDHSSFDARDPVAV